MNNKKTNCNQRILMLLLLALLLCFLMAGSIAADQVSMGTLGAKSARLGCENLKIGVVGASNMVLANYRDDFSEILQQKCEGAEIILKAKGGTGPAGQTGLVADLLTNDNLDYVLLDPSINGILENNLDAYTAAVITLASMVKNKDKNIKVVVLATTPAKNYADWAEARQVTQDAFNQNLIQNKLGRPDLIDYAVDVYSAVEDPAGSDFCGKYCVSDKVHLNTLGQTQVVNTVISKVFSAGVATTSTVSSSYSAGNSVSCLNAQKCNEIDDVWRLHLGTLIRGVDEIWDPQVIPPRWRQWQVSTARPSVLMGTIGQCPENMANIDGEFCIDKWEASIYNKNNPSERASMFYPSIKNQADVYYNNWVNKNPPNQKYFSMPSRGPEIQDGFEPLAISQSNVIPNMLVTKVVAEKACANAGKRLCTQDEWVKACMGPSNTLFPYGNSYVADKCNKNTLCYPPGITGWQKVMSPSEYDPSDPRNAQAAVDNNCISKTGSFNECTNDYGVYDMVGNLAEVVSTSASSSNAMFLGSSYPRASTEGCSNVNNAHGVQYTDFTFGFRCCADISGTGKTTSTGIQQYIPAASKLYNALMLQLGNANLCKAIVANAMGESKFDNTVAGDCGAFAEKNSGSSIVVSGQGRCCSFGLWQYNICGGAGVGFLKEYGNPSGEAEKLAVLKDYQKQVDYLVTLLKESYPAEISKQKTTDDWVAWFVANIERPANQATQISVRQKYAHDFETAGTFSNTVTSG